MSDGLLIINKEKNMTSRSVDNLIQRLFHTKKIGHLGTLDPFATGILVVALGKGTKSLPYINDEYKTYVASLKLGDKTDSGDLTGEVILSKDIPTLNEEMINKVLSSFLGESEQIPPMKSAIHYDGKRLYELDRKGIKVEPLSRKVFIKDINLISYKDNIIEFSVNCSKGTYVRTLGEDIANKLNTVGHLISLKRIKVGDIDISKARKIEDIKEEDLINPALLISYQKVDVSELIKEDILNGKDIILNSKEDRVLIIEKVNNDLIALAVYNRDKEDIYKIVRGLW